MQGAIASHYFAGESEGHSIHVVPVSGGFRVGFACPDGSTFFGLLEPTLESAMQFYWDDIRRVNS
jgi:hypothetical protein